MKSLRSLGLLLAASLLTSCSWPSAAPLRIGISDWPPYEFLHLAREKGFFAAEGVEVRLVEFASMGDARRAFEHRQIDGGMFSIFETLYVRDQSLRSLKVALVVDFSDGADAVLAAPHVASVPDLRGKRLGIDLGAIGIYVAHRALTVHGLTLEDVNVVSVEDIDMIRALREGSVDAVVNYPPSRTRIEESGLARAIFTSSEIPGEIVDVLALDETVMRARPKDVARLIRAFYRAVDYTRTHPEDAYAIMAQREHLTPEVFRSILHTGITLVGLEEQARFLSKGTPFAATVVEVARVLHARNELSSISVAEHILCPEPAQLALDR